jgi:predicted nucleic acid-binding protein
MLLTAKACRRFIARCVIENVQFVVPTDFEMEVLNPFTVAMYQKSMTLATATRVVRAAFKLNFDVRSPSRTLVLELTNQMNRASAADQTYVALSQKLKCQFVTADAPLVSNAQQKKIARVVYVDHHPWSV